MTDLRCFVTAPIPDGYAYWDVRDRDSPHGPNFALVTISKHMPNAEARAREICERLNS